MCPILRPQVGADSSEGEGLRGRTGVGKTEGLPGGPGDVS